MINGDGPFKAYETRGGRFCIACKETDWTDPCETIGPVFAKESVAREFATTLNALLLKSIETDA